MNRKGQIDKIITTVPVMILLLVLSVIFLFLTFAMRALHEPAKPSISTDCNNCAGMETLMETIQIDDKKYTILDGILLSGNKLERSEEERKFNDAFIKEIVNFAGKDKCLLLSTPINYYFAGNGIYEPDNKASALPLYKDRKSVAGVIMTVKGNPFPIDYYYGECLK